LMGEGVDLRFCSVRPDYVAHALEEAQHLDRICLLAGVADPAQKQQVDVLVPDGRVLDGREAPAGRWYAVDLRIIPPDLSGDRPSKVIEQPAEPAATAPPPPAATAPATAPAPATLLAEKDVPSDSSSADADALPQATQYLSGGTRGTTSSYGGMLQVQAAPPRFRGAGRSERKESGAAAFYFAGVSAAPSERILTHLTDANREVMRKYDAAKSPDGAAAHDASSYTDDTPDPLGLRDLDRRMTEFQSTAQRRGAETLLEDAPDSPFIGLWAHLHTSADPFALSPGETAGFGVDAAAATTLHRSPVAAELSLNGTLVAVSSQALATGAKVTGRATGWVEVVGRAHGHTGQPRSARLAVKAELVLIAKPDGTSSLDMKLTLPNGYVVDVATRWRGDPVSAVTEVKVDLAGILRILASRVPTKEKAAVRAVMEAVSRRSDRHHVEIARATALENADVYQPANRQHVAAVAALKSIEKGLAQPGFRQMAERLLFPPPEQREEGARIQATRDWVLFHRRRGSSCDCGCGAPPAVATRRYRVFEARVHGDDSVAALRRYLEAGREVPAKDLRPVTFVEFPGGSSHLSTPDAAIEEAWRLVWRKGSRLALGAVAGQGAGADDPDALAVERLERVAQVVAELTPQTADAEFIPLPMVPSWLDADGADGVMMLVTRSATTCLEVWEARGADAAGLPLPGDRVLEEIRRQAESGSLEADLKRLGRPIGTVTFDAGTTQDASGLDQVESTWKSLKLDVPESGLVVSGESATTRALLVKQGQTVAGGLGAGTIAIDGVADKEKLTSCAGILFLAPRQQAATTCMEVYRVGQSLTISAVLDAMQRGDWEKDSGHFAAHLARATFRAGAVEDDGGLAGAWTASGGGGVARAMVASTASDPTEVKAQVDGAIALTTLLPGGGTADHATTASNPAPDGSCGSVLLLEADQAPPATTCHEVYLVPQTPGGGGART
ncbi:MAG TPA: hypothetical protein VFH27_18645, partial [Longimicrobiaceae bacterium]|nr:hypothetical protein [Longimicrobiaceae bacterium]